MTKRDEVIAGICARTGKTREQAEAFLDILGSAFRRRGWLPGEPLEESEIGAKLDTFIGQREPAAPVEDGETQQ